MVKEDDKLAELKTFLEQLETQTFVRLNDITFMQAKTSFPKHIAISRLNGQLNAIFTIKSFVEYLKMK